MIRLFMKEIHIGKWIQAKMEAEGRSAAWLAEQLHCDRSNCYITVKKTASVLAAVIKNIPTKQARP
jgi:hypothetical protein